jgi:23S rRNA pseudouridine1911/1915/1917 synthase
MHADGDDDRGGFAAAAPDSEAEAIRNEVPVQRQLTATHRVLRCTVGRHHGLDWRLDRYLAALLPTLSRSLIRRWVERGCVTIDGVVAADGTRTRPGQRLELRGPLPARDGTGAAAAPLAILYQDEAMIVCNKPAGQLAHQAGTTMSGTLLNQLQDHVEALGDDPAEVRLVNRIDRDTSGIVLASRSIPDHVRLAAAIEARDVDKEYRAICSGCPDEARGDWREPIGEGPDGSIARAVRPDGQACLTSYAVLERAPEGRYALLALRLHTGRQHQIRVHASHHGHALVGDWVYGLPCAELPGQALHAAAIGFRHPRSGAPLRIEAPLPTGFDRLWARLREGGSVQPIPLSAEQRSKLGRSAPDPGPRRPSWLSPEEFERLRAEAGE